MSIIKDINLAPSGEMKINWVERNMPVLRGIRRFSEEKPFKGLKVALSVHLEAKTAYLCRVMEMGGAEMYVTGSNPLSTQDDVAAALAAGYCALKDKSANADSYLSHAENIFALADKTRSDDAYNNSDAGGFYRSSHFYDELFYAANWLYIATGEKSYLDKAASYIPNLGKELGSDELKYSWGMCWDDVMQGGLLLYAINTGDSFYTSRVKKHLDYWTDSVKELDGGLRWLTTWGCLRYANTAGFLASVACDTVLKGTDTKKYQEFYQEQIDYSLGDNPDHQSFVVGYGENFPKNPHHRTAHASWKNALDTPETTSSTAHWWAVPTRTAPTPTTGRTISTTRLPATITPASPPCSAR